MAEKERRLQAVVDHEDGEVYGCDKSGTHMVELALGIHVTAGEECFVIHTGQADAPEHLSHYSKGQEVTIVVDGEGNARFAEEAQAPSAG